MLGPDWQVGVWDQGHPQRLVLGRLPWFHILCSFNLLQIIELDVVCFCHHEKLTAFSSMPSAESKLQLLI